MRKFLACCEEIEQTVAEVYRHWQQVYADDAEFAALWGELVDDELAHVQQIRLARRLPMNGVFTNRKIDTRSLETLLVRARKLLVDVQKVTLSKEKALRTAIKMEEAFNKAHVNNVADFTDPTLKAMFTSLARDDAQHMATLQRYCDRVFGGD